MAHTIGLKGTDAESHKLVRALEDAALAAVASGKVEMTMDGQPVVIGTAETSHGRLDAHPTDHKRDRHTPHAGGRKHDAPVSVTFLPKP